MKRQHAGRFRCRGRQGRGFPPDERSAHHPDFNNLGDSKSLITHPATSTHHLTDAERAAVGISPGSVRLSVGLEDAADLIEDLEQALAGV